MASERLTRQIAFLTEADKLKQVLRRTPLVDGSRRENTAEHCWHLALVAIVFHEYAAPEVDLARALEMIAIHDLVEIDAGDTFAYDTQGLTTKAARENAAAERIFGLLPAAQGSAMRALWEEFEARETPDAAFANAVDRFQAVIQNVGAGGGTWGEYQLSRADVLRRMAPIETALPGAWPMIVETIDRYCDQGVLRR